MKRLMKDLFTGNDSRTFESAHVIWAIGALTFIVMACYHVFRTGNYPTGFGQDFGWLNAGGAGGSWMRAKADQTKGTQP